MTYILEKSFEKVIIEDKFSQCLGNKTHLPLINPDSRRDPHQGPSTKLILQKSRRFSEIREDQILLSQDDSVSHCQNSNELHAAALQRVAQTLHKQKIIKQKLEVSTLLEHSN
jgi:hypothetical protein